VLDRFCRELARRAPRGPGIVARGPPPAPRASLRGRHRRRFLLRAPREAPLQDLVADWLHGAQPPGGVRLQVDIDPYSFL
ncbi:MAG: primosomal protein N', partial [Alphaproteobacteria bacterium]